MKEQDMVNLVQTFFHFANDVRRPLRVTLLTAERRKIETINERSLNKP